MKQAETSKIPRLFAGLVAIGISVFALFAFRGDPAIVTASLFFILACGTDTLQARIPNLLTVSLASAGLTFNTLTHGWSGTLGSLIGLAVGFLLLLLPYLMGGFGGGDVKTLAALGALAGPQAILHIFVYMAFFGGAMAVLHYLCNTDLKNKAREWWCCAKASALARDPRLLRPAKSETLRFPYAAAIAFGYYTYIWRGGVL